MEKMMKKATAYIQSRVADLPEDWEVYSMRKLEAKSLTGGQYVKMRGSLPSGNDDHAREFILPLVEYLENCT
jgi:hypothetical protein